MIDITFRLIDNLDPEERLEEAAAWKAVYDATGGRAVAVTDDTPTVFGRTLKHEVSPHLMYWSDPAFLNYTKRRFSVHNFEDAVRVVDDLHADGLGAFVKSTRDKHAIFKCPIGTSLRDAAGDMVWSFIDGGPQLMVQEYVDVTYEYRFFCINRKIVTDTPHHPKLTPIDHPVEMVYKTTKSNAWYRESYMVKRELLPVAQNIAQLMQHPTGVIDCGYIKGVPGCVEINPFRLGQVGLFGCDVRALAAAAIQDYTRSQRGKV